MKLSVVGAGNAGVFTALYIAWYGRESNLEIELIYNPEIPPERVGQATLIDAPELLSEATGFNWYNNPIHATMKSGILYEGWGNKNDKVFHPFPAHRMAMHYCPWEMQRHVLNSGLFKVVEKSIEEVNNIDSDLIFDCRGKPDDYSDYEELINPTNACILAKPNWDTTKSLWSRHVATPDGWTFVIPTHTTSPSNDYCVGYCYNSNITSKEDAEKNMLEMFDVEVTKHVNYRNYVAKNPVIDDRIILNGNRLFFIEPLESSSTQAYIEIPKYLARYGDVGGLGHAIKEYIKYTQNFILWHYQFGSKYDTPFWNYALSLKFIDHKFDYILRGSKNKKMSDIKFDERGGSDPCYGQWNNYAFKLWYEGMTKKEK
tara:strand:+ start:55 stop:1170 length:1116 start_codon:yes stop_codon:yes gene_type:complete